MVRLEEHPWDPSSTLVLDNRASAHVGDGGELPGGEEADERLAGVGPLERGGDPVGVPAVGEPQLGAAVAVVADEGEVVDVADRAGGEGEGAQQDLVARGLVVEAEAGAAVAGLDDAAGVSVPALGVVGGAWLRGHVPGDM